MMSYVSEARIPHIEGSVFFGASDLLSVGASGGGYALMFAHMSSLIMVGKWPSSTFLFLSH
jgi:hypothetical protein